MKLTLQLYGLGNVQVGNAGKNSCTRTTSRAILEFSSSHFIGRDESCRQKFFALDRSKDEVALL